LVAICELDDARLQGAAARYAIPVTSRDHRELVSSADVDIVVVCTPPGRHEQVVIDALLAGKHVVCEKPLAHNLASADRIIAAARERPGRLSTVYQFRYLPEVRRSLWLRDSDGLGALLSGRFYRFARFHRPGRHPRAPWWGRWDVAGGGAVMTQLIHELDLMCLLFGRPARAWGVVDTLKEMIESEDTCAAVVQFESGALCSCHSTMSAHRSTAGFDIFGTLGSVHSPWSFECLDRDRRRALRVAALEAVPDEQPLQSSAHTPYWSSVLDAMQAHRPLPSGPDEGRLSLELATAIYASSLLRSPVSLPIGPGQPHYGGIERADYQASRGPGRKIRVGH
jgi:predicted dehydrogenase